MNESLVGRPAGTEIPGGVGIFCGGDVHGGPDR